MWLYYYKLWKVSLATASLIHSRFIIPVDRICSIMESIQFTIKNLPYTTAPNLLKLCDKINSTKFVLGNIAQSKARNLYKIIQVELKWDDRRILKRQDHSENYFFLQNNLIRLNSCVLHFTKSLLFLFLQAQVTTPYPHNLLKEGENIYALNSSVNTK